MGPGSYKIEISPQALGDLEEIVNFIAADNPQAAGRFGQRLIDEAEAIVLHPFAGRVVPGFGDTNIRERIFRVYRIIYRVYEDRHLLVVSRFWHGARDTPELGEVD